MKKFIVTILLTLVVTTSAFANELICEKIRQLSENIMKNRQQGVPINKMIDIANSEPKVASLMKAIVMDAYNQPKYQTAKYKQEAVVEFANRQYVTCIQILEDAKKKK
jgi:hypothetical protein